MSEHDSRKSGRQHLHDSYRIVSAIEVTNKVPTDDYRSLGVTPPEGDGPWIAHHNNPYLESIPEFELNLELVDSDSLQVALELNNPWGEDVDETLDEFSTVNGPGFPTILVGPNAGGKSVALKMIETFHILSDFIQPHLLQMQVMEILAMSISSNHEYEEIYFSEKEVIPLVNSLNQWDWLGPSWDLKLNFEEYSFDPLFSVGGLETTPREEWKSNPLVSVGNRRQKLNSVNVEFRKAIDCYQIRLTLPDSVLMILLGFDEFNSVTDIELISGSIYKMVSGVGDKFLPISVPEHAENSDLTYNPDFTSESTFRDPRIGILMRDISNSIEEHTAYLYDEAANYDDVEAGEMFLSSYCDFAKVSWYEFLGEEVLVEDVSTLVSSLNDPIMGGSSAVRIDTLRRSSSSQSLLTPTQRAVADLCNSLNRVWEQTEQQLSHPKFYRLSHLVFPADQLAHGFKSMKQKKNAPEPTIEDFSKKGYVFPVRNGRFYQDTPVPFTPSDSLSRDLLENTNPLYGDDLEKPEQQDWDFHVKLLINRIDETQIGKLYTQIHVWQENKEELQSLAKSFQDIQRALPSVDSEFHSFLSQFHASLGLFSSHLEYEFGPENLTDAQFSIFSHTHHTLLESLYHISNDLLELSKNISGYLETDINIIPIIREDFEELFEDPNELDKIAEQMDLPYLSSGQAQLLTMLTQLELSALTTSVVLLDEPELSLHDKLIADLYDYLCEYSKTNNVQVICSTHSTTLAGLGLEHSVFVERKDDLDE